MCNFKYILFIETVQKAFKLIKIIHRCFLDKLPNTEADFYTTLHIFLNGDGQRYNADIVFRNNKIWVRMIFKRLDLDVIEQINVCNFTTKCGVILCSNEINVSIFN